MLPLRDGVALKERFRTAIGIKPWSGALGGVLDSVDSSLYNARALLSGPFGPARRPGSSVGRARD